MYRVFNLRYMFHVMISWRSRIVIFEISSQCTIVLLCLSQHKPTRLVKHILERKGAQCFWVWLYRFHLRLVLLFAHVVGGILVYEIILLYRLHSSHGSNLILLYVLNRPLWLHTGELSDISQFLRIYLLNSFISLRFHFPRFWPGSATFRRFCAPSPLLLAFLPVGVMSLEESGAELLIIIFPIEFVEMSFFDYVVAYELVWFELIISIHDLTVLVVADQIHVDQGVVRHWMPLFGWV